MIEKICQQMADYNANETAWNYTFRFSIHNSQSKQTLKKILKQKSIKFYFELFIAWTTDGKERVRMVFVHFFRKKNECENANMFAGLAFFPEQQ